MNFRLICLTLRVQNMYIANHAYMVEGMEFDESQREVDALLGHACQPKYVQAVHYENPGDLGERANVHTENWS